MPAPPVAANATVAAARKFKRLTVLASLSQSPLEPPKYNRRPRCRGPAAVRNRCADQMRFSPGSVNAPAQPRELILKLQCATLQFTQVESVRGRMLKRLG